MTEIVKQLNNKFGERVKEIRTNRNSHSTTREKDSENNTSGPANLEQKEIRRKHPSKREVDKGKRIVTIISQAGMNSDNPQLLWEW